MSDPHFEITSQANNRTPLEKAVITTCRNKPDSSFLIPTSAVNVSLLAFAAECYAVVSALYVRRYYTLYHSSLDVAVLLIVLCEHDTELPLLFSAMLVHGCAMQ